MVRKSLSLLIIILSLSLIISGCPKKTVVKDEPTVKKADELATERQAERKEKEGKEAAGTKEGFEKSLVAKKTPGIEGEVFESKLLKDIHFDFDKHDVRPQDTMILKENAALLVKHPAVKVQVEGHCDERGSNEYNLALGERRASSAKKYLVSLGVAESRISTISYGEEAPLDSGHHEVAWAKNRRAHFIILSK